MAIITLQVRQDGDQVVIVTNKGIKSGTITNRTITKDDDVIYSIKLNSKAHHQKRAADEVFDTPEQLVTYYSKEFKEKPLN